MIATSRSSHARDPSSTRKPFRWGLSSPGAIAVQFTKSIHTTDSAEVMGIASRDIGRAGAFAAENGIPHAYGSLRELAVDPRIDGVYICSPVHAHAAAVEIVAAAGKAALIEKPFAVSAEEAAGMFRTARRHSTFVMEAMWTRFLPVWRGVDRLIADGAIGEVESVSASLGFPIIGGPRDSNLLDRGRGGGSLLEVGVYPAQLLQRYLGVPTQIVALQVDSDTGVDLSVAASLLFGGKTATFQSSMSAMLPNTATIVGSAGSVIIPPFFHAATKYEVHSLTGRMQDPFTVEVVDGGFDIGPLAYQALHVADRVDARQIVSDIMPPEDTIATLRLLDGIRESACAGRGAATRRTPSGEP